MSAGERWYVEIWSYGVDRETGKPEERKGPFASERQADRVDGGMNINLNHEKFYTLVVQDVNR